MNRAALISQIKQKKSYLCVGLDPDIEKLPKGIPKNLEGILEFNRRIIEATKDFCVAYKANTAFYECYGERGWELLEKTLGLIPAEHFLIADAKRGDIGNTSKKYAEAFFDPKLPYRVDAVTVNPYMGKDSVLPFLEYSEKWTILLALTSNQGSSDFQKLKTENGIFLYEEVLLKSQEWGTSDHIMFVIGATQAESIKSIRSLVPEHFLLVPGLGAQGGNLEEISKAGLNQDGGILVNASRSILYASDLEDFETKAAMEAKIIQNEMDLFLEDFLLV